VTLTSTGFATAPGAKLTVADPSALVALPPVSGVTTAEAVVVPTEAVSVVAAVVPSVVLLVVLVSVVVPVSLAVLVSLVVLVSLAVLVSVVVPVSLAVLVPLVVESVPVLGLVPASAGAATVEVSPPSVAASALKNCRVVPVPAGGWGSAWADGVVSAVAGAASDAGAGVDAAEGSGTMPPPTTSVTETGADVVAA